MNFQVLTDANFQPPIFVGEKSEMSRTMRVVLSSKLSNELRENGVLFGETVPCSDHQLYLDALMGWIHEHIKIGNLRADVKYLLNDGEVRYICSTTLAKYGRNTFELTIQGRKPAALRRSSWEKEFTELAV